MSKLDKSLIKNLNHDIFHGRVILFAGAGVGIRAGLPGWRNLLESFPKKDPLYEQLLKKELDAGEYIKAADLCSVATTGNSFYEDFCKHIKSFQPRIESVLNLVKIPFLKTITTNYDKCIEEAYCHVHRNIPASFSNSEPELQRFGLENGSIIHIHGHIDQPSSIVIDSASYSRIETMEQYKAMMRSLIQSHSFLFVGVSFDDPPTIKLIEYLKKHLSFYMEHKSYAMLVNPSADVQNLLCDSNIEPIVFDSYKEKWEGIAALAKPKDDFRLIMSNNHRYIPALSKQKQNLSLAVAALTLKNGNQIASTRGRLVSGLVLSLICNGIEKKDDLVDSVAKSMTISKEQALDGVDFALNHLQKENTIEFNNNSIICKTQLDDNQFLSSIENFIETCKDSFKMIHRRDLNISNDEMVEILVYLIETCSISLADSKSVKFLGLPNLEELISAYLTETNPITIKDTCKALTLGFNSLSKETAVTLAKLAKVAYSFKTAYFDYNEISTPIPTGCKDIIVDTNILLPALIPIGPETTFNLNIISQLKKFGIQVCVTDGTIEEVIGHQKNAIELHNTFDKDDMEFAQNAYYYKNHKFNVFQRGFAIYREKKHRIAFTKYLQEKIGWNSKASLKKKLSEIGFKTLDSVHKNDYKKVYDQLKENLEKGERKDVHSSLLRHDAEMLQLALRTNPGYTILTYERRIVELCSSIQMFSGLISKIINPLTLFSSFESEDLPEIDCKAYITSLLPLDEQTTTEVIMSNYQAALLNDAKGRQMEDIDQILGKVSDCLMEYALKSHLNDIDEIDLSNPEYARQIFNFVDPKFIEFSKNSSSS